ncbi:GNAT family N-acetyltransferase [Pseudaestuariivita rosea]|uniref:GNAT family N-acetyltransferase n=1 Tax=Pseudaestuariivita rosea TaxID=2763263 RepID=UPI001ABABB7A|nr:GNAT family N-acetyltransferase [Pseudaestuariivita rosea]
MTVEIRPLRADDRPHWDRLWTAYLAFYETQLPQHIYDSTFQRLLGDDPADFSGLIATLDGQPVGLVHYLFHRHCWRVENTCYLQDLYADPQVRGQGIGRKLIEAVYRAADAHGTQSVYWLTQEFNTNARYLYDKVGEVTPFVKYQRPVE